MQHVLLQIQRNKAVVQKSYASSYSQVAELATQFFITNDKPNVAGLVLAGSAEFKNELQTSDMFDGRLQAVVLAVVDVSYGTDTG